MEQTNEVKDRRQEVRESVEFDFAALAGFWLLYNGFINNDTKSAHYGSYIIETLRQLGLFNFEDDVFYCATVLNINGIDKISKWDRGREFAHYVEVELNRANIVSSDVVHFELNPTDKKIISDFIDNFDGVDKFKKDAEEVKSDESV